MIEKELRRYLLTIPVIRSVVSNHIYAGRIPKTATPTHSILIRKISAGRSYNLGGENAFVQPIVSIDLLSRNANAELILDQLFNDCRKALNVYAKAPGLMGATRVSSIQIISETVDVPQLPAASGINWKRQLSFDIEIIHDQEVEFA